MGWGRVEVEGWWEESLSSICPLFSHLLCSHCFFISVCRLLSSSILLSATVLNFPFPLPPPSLHPSAMTGRCHSSPLPSPPPTSSFPSSFSLLSAEVVWYCMLLSGLLQSIPRLDRSHTHIRKHTQLHRISPSKPLNIPAQIRSCLLHSPQTIQICHRTKRRSRGRVWVLLRSLLLTLMWAYKSFVTGAWVLTTEKTTVEGSKAAPKLGRVDSGLMCVCVMHMAALSGFTLTCSSTFQDE